MKRIVSIAVALLLSLSLTVPAYAVGHNRVDVIMNICPVETYDVYDPVIGLDRLAGPLSRPLVLVLPDGHPDMEIQLTTTGGVGFTIDGFAAVTATATYAQMLEYLSGNWVNLTANTISLFNSYVKKAKYDVYMYGYDEEYLWGEDSADDIPDGHRVFDLGADVKYITVYAWYDLGMGEAFKENPIPARVSYEGARVKE